MHYWVMSDMGTSHEYKVNFSCIPVASRDTLSAHIIVGPLCFSLCLAAMRCVAPCPATHFHCGISALPWA